MQNKKLPTSEKHAVIYKKRKEECENRFLKIHAENKSKPQNWLVSNCERRKRRNRNALVV